MKARQITMDQLPELQGSVHRRVVPAGETLFLAGETPGMLYQVVRGIAKLVSNSANGREVITELVFPGEVIDFMGCLDEGPSQVTAMALQQQDVEVLAIPLERVRHHVGLMNQFHTSFRAKARFHREMMVAMAVERVEQRAVRALLMLADYLADPAKGALSLNFALTRQEFSELIGSTLETAIRVLSALRRRGLISEDHGRLTLRAVPQLHELCPAA